MTAKAIQFRALAAKSSSVILRRGAMAAGAALMGASALLCAVTGARAQEASVRIGTSSTGSVYYTLAVAISKMLKDHANLGSTVEPVGGSTPNVHALNTNRVDVAITNAMASYDGYHAKGRFKTPVDLGMLVVGNPSLRQLLIRKGSGITKIEDLKGRTFVGRRPALPEIAMITEALFKVYNIDPKSVRVIPTTETNEAMDAIASNTVDAGIIPGSAGAGYFQKASREGKIEFFAIPQDKMNAMLKLLPPAFDLETVPANTYAGQTNPYIAFDLSTTFVASSKHLSEEAGYKIVKTMFDNFEQFKTYHSAAKEWTMERTLKLSKIPFHPGAVRYFKEKNRWDAEMEKRQAELARR